LKRSVIHRRPLFPLEARTSQTEQNRRAHGQNLKKRAAELTIFWNSRRAERQNGNLSIMTGGVPIWLQIDHFGGRRIFL
jgi:hypothetical protein